MLAESERQLRCHLLHLGGCTQAHHPQRKDLHAISAQFGILCVLCTYITLRVRQVVVTSKDTSE